MQSRERFSAAFRAGIFLYRGMGSPLYAALCAGAADDLGILDLCDAGPESMRPINLLAAVHFLLLRNPDDPLSRYYATLVERPLDPERAFPDFARFCRAHAGEIRHVLATRTVQTTYVERCGAVMLALALVAEDAGEPLNLVEIGCSAGVLLTFDAYAYRLEGRPLAGSPAAPLILAPTVRGRPALRIPQIATRTGIDLHRVDIGSPEARTWLLALCFPEYRDQQAHLATALDVVADTEIRMLEGNALELILDVVAAALGPICVFHSACLYYWNAAERAALDALLREASCDRVIHRVGIEPADNFTTWQTGDTDAPDRAEVATAMSGEIILYRYEGGSVSTRIVARASADYETIEWID